MTVVDSSWHAHNNVHTFNYVDVAIGAPYERKGSSANTGAVYIYYGRNTKLEFQEQIPQKVSSCNGCVPWASKYTLVLACTLSVLAGADAGKKMTVFLFVID